MTGHLVDLLGDSVERIRHLDDLAIQLVELVARSVELMGGLAELMGGSVELMGDLEETVAMLHPPENLYRPYRSLLTLLRLHKQSENI